MKISVRVKTRARTGRVEKTLARRSGGDEMHYTVSVREIPAEGRANEAVIELLANYFDVPKSRVKVVSGHKSKQKIIEIV